MKMTVKLYRQWKKLSMVYLGNSLGILINIKYWLYHKYCRFFFKNPTSKFREKSSQIKNLGFGKIGTIECSNLAEQVDNYFSNRQLVGTRNDHVRTDKELISRLSPLVTDCLHQIQNQIESYYGSYFQLHWSTVCRTIPGTDQEISSSFSFHTDDVPNQIMKVFIYLNDVKDQNGAFRTFTYRDSKKIIKEGFASFSPIIRKESQIYITKERENKLNILEGKKGTVLFFDNNLVHRGKIPTERYRDLLEIQVYPSDKPADFTSQVQNSLTHTIVKDYPANPFVNEVHHINGKRLGTIDYAQPKRI